MTALRNHLGLRNHSSALHQSMERFRAWAVSGISRLDLVRRFAAINAWREHDLVAGLARRLLPEPGAEASIQHIRLDAWTSSDERPEGVEEGYLAALHAINTEWPRLQERWQRYKRLHWIAFHHAISRHPFSGDELHDMARFDEIMSGEAGASVREERAYLRFRLELEGCEGSSSAAPCFLIARARGAGHAPVASQCAVYLAMFEALMGAISQGASRSGLSTVAMGFNSLIIRADNDDGRFIQLCRSWRDDSKVLIWRGQEAACEVSDLPGGVQAIERWLQGEH